MIERINFKDKNKLSNNIELNTLFPQEVVDMQTALSCNIIPYALLFVFPVTSVNGMTDIVTFNFPISSVNGQTGNVLLLHPVSSINGMSGAVNFNFPVSSVNSITGVILMGMSDLLTDINYITSNDVAVKSINGYTGNVNLKTTDIENDLKYITTPIGVYSVNNKDGDIVIDFPVSSINGITDLVNFNFPVSSINGMIDNIILKMSDLNNDCNYITTDSIPVSSVSESIPTQISELDNNVDYYNKMSEFMILISSEFLLSGAQPGFLYYIR